MSRVVIIDRRGLKLLACDVTDVTDAFLPDNRTRLSDELPRAVYLTVYCCLPWNDARRRVRARIRACSLPS